MSTILIVDDNRMILQALSDHLESLGYDTEVASSGMDALEILKQTRPDLIIMDIVMPEMSGIEVTKKIRANPDIKTIPVVAFTSQSNRGQWDEIFDDYLVKPFGYDALREIIERFIGKNDPYSESL
jgi:two-component system cell cycle response regulator DivK